MQNNSSQPNQEAFPESDKPFLSYDYFDDLYKVAEHSPIDKIATMSQRLLALLVDTLLFVLVNAIVGFAFYKIYSAVVPNVKPTDSENLSLLPSELLGSFVVTLGFVVLLLTTISYFMVSFAQGQSFGNFVTRTKFVNSRGEQPGYGDAAIRLLLHLLSLAGTVLYAFLYTYVVLLLDTIFGWALDLLYLVPIGFWLYLAVFSARKNNNRQSVFDRCVDIYLIEMD